MPLRSCPCCGSDEVLVDVVATRLLALLAIVITLLTLGFGVVAFWFVPKENLCRQCAYRWRLPAGNPIRGLIRRARAHWRYHVDWDWLPATNPLPRLVVDLARRMETLAEMATMRHARPARPRP